MSSKKNLFGKRVAAFLAAVVLAVLIPYDVNVSVQNGIEVSIEKSVAFAAGNSVTVKKSDAKTATAIHNVISKGKPLTIKVKGDATQSIKLLNSIKGRVKKVNKQGVTFECSYAGYSDGYSEYYVNADQAGVYQYAVKFIDKLYKQARKFYTTDQNFKNLVADCEKYPKEKERKLRWAYDYIARCYYYSYATKDYIEGTTEKTTMSTVSISYKDFEGLKRDDFFYTEEKEYTIVPVKYTLKVPISFFEEDESEDEDDGEDDEEYIPYLTWEYSDGEDHLEYLEEQWAFALEKGGFFETVELEDEAYVITKTESRPYSYEEFTELSFADKLAEATTIPDYGKYNYMHRGSNYASDLLIYKTKNFCDLSEAMKVYAIDRSLYFSSHYYDYGMRYTYGIYYGNTGKEGMKKLYQNKAEGVCQVFAQYELQVWKALDIEAFYNSNYNINHAWSVVKVKNKKGKTLWIPFDYGMEPSPNLSVTEAVRNKYLKTEKMRYKLYLANIPGAPTKKNFKYTDFN